MAFGSLIFNLYELQIKKGNLYAARAESQIRLAGLLKPRRGSIYFTDKNSNLIPAALNRDYPVVFAVPRQIEEPDKTAELLSSILEKPQAELQRKIGKSNDSYELLAAKLGEQQVAAIKNLDLKGIYIDKEEFRFYPFRDLGAHLLGFVGPSSNDDELKGRYGLEAFYEELLRGLPGEEAGGKIHEPVHGSDLVLTIDRNIQSQAEEILAQAILKNKAVGGTVIVEEPRTGKILALANYPAFDPNRYGASAVGDFLSAASQSIYEPGSVFKVITMSAGIDTGKITPETTFTDTGSIVLNNRRIQNYDGKVYGTVSMTKVIENSINIGAVFAERQTGHENFLRYLVKFGFDEKTGLNLPGEVKSSLKNLKSNARDINFATASFGQGVAMTPIALVNAISAIANGGLLMKPYLLSGEKPEVVRRVIKAETASQVAQMMTSAVRKAQVAHIPNYAVAGKTGTAQIPDFKRGGYTDEFIHTFAGFAPAKSPRFAILFKVDKPQVGELAGLTVVPAFRELAQFILNYYNIPPDDLPEAPATAPKL